MTQMTSTTAIAIITIIVSLKINVKNRKYNFSFGITPFVFILENILDLL